MKTEQMSAVILVIDDNLELRENTKELLSLAGYETRTARNGREGIEIARQINPSLILCDVMMPELDGYGTLHAIRNLPGLNNIPFVFLTARAERADIRKGMNLGADDYLTKPFDADELLGTIEARLKKGVVLQNSQADTPEALDAFKTEGVSLDEIRELSVNHDVKKFHAREFIYMEGDSANTLYFVSSGKVKTYQANEWGKELITAIYNPGDFFGYQALIERVKHNQSAVTLEDTDVALIPATEFFNLLYSSHEVALKFIRFISNNASETEKKLLKIAYGSARKKVAEALLLIHEKYYPGEKKAESFPAYRENISAIAGISPESVSRNLADFREEGLIATDNGMIRILNFEKLESLKS